MQRPTMAKKTTTRKPKGKPRTASAARSRAARAVKKKTAARPVSRSKTKKTAVKRAAPRKSNVKSSAKKTTVTKPVAKKSASSKSVKSVKSVKPAPKKAPARKPAPVKAAAPKKVAPKTVAKVAPKPQAKAKAPVPKAVPAPVRAEKPFSARKLGDFAVSDYVVYPTHGVGKIEAIEEQTIAGFQLRLFVIRFEKEKMTLRVPVEKAEESGLRKLSSRQQIDVALSTLKGRSRVSRAMWSRRAQEYEAKINSGDPVSIAEVVRDLHRNAGQPDQSYSERQIYEAALERLARELAAVEKIDPEAAAVKLEQVLQKAA